MPDEDVIIPDVEDFKIEAEKETEVVFIKEEIKIPDIMPTYKRKAPAAKKKSVHYEKLPEIRHKKNPTGKLTQKIIKTAIITVLLFLMMLSSIILNAKGIDGESKNIVAAIINHNYIISGGVLLNGC